ncbi:DMT family transporter [Amorphus orientalis]|uniref:Drug/metabolite transporter (DMT)-like permease n=1 Tax=Amorphus orientalis TaxID=649198 RepID=A0AAE4ASH8_9HYPH|nr:DMT family transporter [Amorphus orientalis]MDQ0313979.1 drug/metabolite transporter (DMT)-like permease [Amorphus orientalis]
MTSPSTAAPAPAPLQLTARDWCLLVALSVLWGSSFFFAKIAVTEIPPLTLVALRVGIAGLALQIVLIAQGHGSPVTDRRFPALFVLGVVNNVIPFSLLFWAQQTLPAGLAAIFNATTPIFTMMLATVFTADDKATWLKIAGIGLGFSGVVLMLGTGLSAGATGHLLAELACLGAALSYGVSALIARRLAAAPPVFLATGQFTGATMVIVPLALIVDAPWTLPAPSLPAIGAVLALALASSAFGYLLYFAIIRSAGATNASLVTYLVPMTAILLGALFLGERLGLFEYAGMVLIIGGVALAQGRLRRLRRTAATNPPGGTG